jgi:hypothetical protein
MARYEEMLSAPRPRARQPKAELDHIQVKAGEDGGHIVTHHMEHNGGPWEEPKAYPFAEHEGPKPQLPEGHVLLHIAKAMDMPHVVLKDSAAKHHGEGETEVERESAEKE